MALSNVYQLNTRCTKADTISVPFGTVWLKRHYGDLVFKKPRETCSKPCYRSSEITAVMMHLSAAECSDLERLLCCNT
jgi:hypothetical protein